tara:strand:- start:1149 stop:1604 length:456 start_codon:yes stop_codon:yes gene_type:complete
MTPEEKGKRILETVQDMRDRYKEQLERLDALERWGQLMLQGIHEGNLERGICEREDLQAIVRSPRKHTREIVFRATRMLRNPATPRTLTTRVQLQDGSVVVLDPPLMGIMGVRKKFAESAKLNEDIRTKASESKSSENDTQKNRSGEGPEN